MWCRGGPRYCRAVALKFGTRSSTQRRTRDFHGSLGGSSRWRRFLPSRANSKTASEADEWDFVADELLQIDEDRVGNETPTPTPSDRHFEPWSLGLEQFVLGNVRRYGILRKELGFLKPLIRRAFLDHHHLRYNEALRLGEDYALYARALALRARFLVVPVEGYASVVRADSISGRHDKRDLELLRDSDLELTVSRTLTPRERRALKKHYLSVDCRVQWLTVIEALKSRRYAQFLAAFCRSPKVSLFLIIRLFEQVCQRVVKTGI